MRTCQRLKLAAEKRIALEGFTTTSGCPFCEEAQDPRYALRFLPPAWPVPSRILWQNEHVMVVPGYGPLVYPYVLIITTRHITCAMHTTIDEREAILDAINYLREHVFDEAQTLTVFEHGECGGRTSSACIDHCHLHVVDGVFQFADHLRCSTSARPVTFGVDPLPPISGPYLFAGSISVSHPRNIDGAVTLDDAASSQYFRRLLASLTGEQQWNWRAGMNPEMMLRVMSTWQISKE